MGPQNVVLLGIRKGLVIQQIVVSVLRIFDFLCHSLWSVYTLVKHGVAFDGNLELVFVRLVKDGSKLIVVVHVGLLNLIFLVST